MFPTVLFGCVHEMEDGLCNIPLREMFRELLGALRASRYYFQHNDMNHLMVVSFLKAELYLSEKWMGVWQVWEREEKERGTCRVLYPSCRRFGVYFQ